MAGQFIPPTQHYPNCVLSGEPDRQLDVSRKLRLGLSIPSPYGDTTRLDNHVRDLVSIDFFTVPTARSRVLFVFIVLSHERCRVVHFNITEHPTAEWAAQQIVEAFPDDLAPRYLIRDRDGIYGKYFQHRVQGMGIQQVRTAPRSPWQNPYSING